MSQHVQELSHQNQDEEIQINVINNGSLDVANRPEILSNADTNRNTSHFAVRNLFNRSLNKKLLKTIVDELKKLNQGMIETDKKIQNLQYMTLGFIVSEIK
jgi:hypothetical protein